MAANFHPVGLDEEDAEDLLVADDRWQELRQIDVDLKGLTLGIEYVGANGVRSMRRVTFISISGNDDAVYVRARCHERRALRTFRSDRIASIVDMDGEVHDDPAAFILGLIAATSESEAAAPGFRHRVLARHGIAVLVALSLADGAMHPEELDVIVRYVGRRADLAGLPFEPDDEEAVRSYVKRYYPTDDALDEALAGLDKEDAVGKRLFLRHARMVMEADGRCEWDEMQLLERINAAISA